MRIGTRVRFSAVAVALCMAASTTVRADAPASAADVQQLLDDQNYAGAVSAASRLLAASGAAAASVDKAQLYAIKGEAHLHLKQYPQAADAFGKGAKAASDPATAATDAAIELLVRRSRNGTYTPKQPAADGTKPTPVAILPADDRKAALGDLFTDEFAAGPKLSAAKTAKTVPQLLTAADTANRLRQLELAATGTDQKTKPEVTAIADHAHGLLETNLQAMAERVADIRRLANTQTMTYRPMRNPGVVGGIQNVPTVRKAGLTQRTGSELRDIVTTCQKIGPAADAFAKATADGGAPASGSTWDALAAEATRTASQAQDVLSADYSNGLQ